jgi:hypothetical protein
MIGIGDNLVEDAAAEDSSVHAGFCECVGLEMVTRELHRLSDGW